MLHECPLVRGVGASPTHLQKRVGEAPTPLQIHFTAAIFTKTTPCGATVASYLSLNSPTSFCRHKSRTVCLPVRFRSEKLATTLTGSAPALNNPTALDPSSRFFA